jgi:phosphoglycerol transferase MdoB-like AlkP superfamily enzyme
VSDPDRRTRSLLLAPVAFFTGVLLLLTLSRAAHVAWLGSRVTAVDGVAGVFLGGLRMDVLVLSMVTLPALVVTLVLGARNFLGRGVLQLVRVYFVVWAGYFALLELTTPSFVIEFDRRPDRLFLEYLVHPREVGGMLLKDYKLELMLCAALSAGAFVLAWRVLGRAASPVRAMGPVQRVGWLVLLVPLLFLGARSSLRHRPANPASVAFSSDHLVNDLALSSGYSVLYAAYAIKDEAGAGDVYGELESTAAFVDEVRKAMVTVRQEDFIDPALPTLHRTTPTHPRVRPLNLVILLEESLGAQFCAALGGRPVTQFLDTLASEGWWFDRMYATGTRSVNGIEAVVSGFMPTPARAVVKLGKAQQGFYTIADHLGRQGYRTQFIYGGEGHFDNMARFFTGNGFQEIIDQDDFVDPVFVGSWGACDDDIFARLHQELLAAGDRPIFSLAFSVSNHSPWEFPAGRIVPYEAEGEDLDRANSVRYADAALATFFERARAAPYWKDTVFVVIADHDARVLGASLVPIPHFHIPAVILGADIEPRRDSRIVSQIDLAPTLLSLIGVGGDHPMVGHDLTRLPADAVGRAIMQYDENQAFLEGERVIVLQPQRPPTQYRFDGETLHPVELDPSFGRKALAHALLPSFLYRDRLYCVPETPSDAQRIVGAGASNP